MKKAVQVVPYDERWPEAFGREEGRLAALLGPAAVAIHHIGSTSVLGLWAKPVLDVLVETADLAMIDQLEPAFVAAGYVPKGEYGIAGRRYFSRPKGMELKTHVHVFQEGDPAVARHLLFRDVLRRHPRVAEEYCALKRQLAHECGGDAGAYQAGKGGFISRIEATLMLQQTVRRED
jgi:GrpB-like predicted nucleotidyltransferase (UPF0157 family)